MLPWVIAGLALVTAGWLAWRLVQTRSSMQAAGHHIVKAQHDL